MEQIAPEKHLCFGCKDWNGGEGHKGCLTCPKYKDIEPLPYEPHIEYVEPSKVEAVKAETIEANVETALGLLQHIDLKLATVFFQHNALGCSTATLALFWSVDPTTVRRWLKEARKEMLEIFCSRKTENET